MCYELSTSGRNVFNFVTVVMMAIQAKGMLQDKIHTVLHELADEAPSTFQECINDTDVLVDGLFGSMEWAFHCKYLKKIFLAHASFSVVVGANVCCPLSLST